MQELGEPLFHHFFVKKVVTLAMDKNDRWFEVSQDMRVAYIMVFMNVSAQLSECSAIVIVAVLIIIVFNINITVIVVIVVSNIITLILCYYHV